MNFTTLLKVAAALPLLTLAACVETTAPVCDATNKVDVPGLDRSFKLSMMLDPSAAISQAEVALEHTGLGEYKSKDGVMSTCQVGAWTIGESPTKFGTYEQTVLALNAQTLTLNPVLVDPKALKAAGVKYELVDRPTSSSPHKKLRAFFQPTASQTIKSLVIHNEDAHAKDVLARETKPNALGLTLY